MKSKIIILLTCLLAFNFLNAQRIELKSKELGFNMSPMIAQIIPFSNGTRLSGPFGIMYRSGRNNRYFNIELGVQIFDSFNDQNNYFNLAIGFLRKRSLGDKANFFNSYNFLVSSGSFNEPNDPGSEDADGSLGVSYAVGIEYKLKEFLYIGTETHIFAGTSGDQVRLHIIPPVGIFLIVKLN